MMYLCILVSERYLRTCSGIRGSIVQTEDIESTLDWSAYISQPYKPVASVIFHHTLWWDKSLGATTPHLVKLSKNSLTWNIENNQSGNNTLMDG